MHVFYNLCLIINDSNVKHGGDGLVMTKKMWRLFVLMRKYDSLNGIVLWPVHMHCPCVKINVDMVLKMLEVVVMVSVGMVWW